MGTKHTFSATKRTIMGKASKNLRKQGLLVGHVFASGVESLPVQADLKSFRSLIETVGETGLLYLQVAEEDIERPVLIDELQLDPITGTIIHVAFRQVSLKEKVTAEVAIEFTGEVSIPESVVVTVRDSIEVEALPTDLPEKFLVDLSSLTQIGQSITVADLAIDKQKVSLVLAEGQEPEEMPVVLIQEQREEEPTEEASEAETGEAPAESEAKSGESAPETTEKSE